MHLCIKTSKLLKLKEVQHFEANRTLQLISCMLTRSKESFNSSSRSSHEVGFSWFQFFYLMSRCIEDYLLLPGQK